MHVEMDKQRLLDLIRVEYNFLERTLAAVPPERLAETGVCGEWSVKDIIAHITAWERRLLGWLAQAKRREAPTFPEPGYTGADVDELNDRDYRDDRERPAADILADFRAIHAEVMTCVESFPEEELFELHRLKDIWREPPLNFIIYNTYDHYHEHAQNIRAWLAGGS